MNTQEKVMTVVFFAAWLGLMGYAVWVVRKK